MKHLKIFWRAIYLAQERQLIEISGYIAYAILLAFFPFITFLVALGGVFGHSDSAQIFLSQVYLAMPQQSVAFIKPVVEQTISNNPGTFLTISFLGVIYFNLSGVEALRTGLNNAYGLKEKRALWRRLLQGFGLLIVGGLGFLAASILVVGTPLTVGRILDLIYLSEFTENMLVLVPYVIGFFLMSATLVVMYRFLPNHRTPPKSTIYGALISTVLWTILASIFSYYLKNFSQYHIIYGSIGGIVITLVFFHMSIFIVMLGAQMNALRNAKEK
jgi:membrane protein